MLAMTHPTLSSLPIFNEILPIQDLASSTLSSPDPPSDCPPSHESPSSSLSSRIPLASLQMPDLNDLITRDNKKTNRQCNSQEFGKSF